MKNIMMMVLWLLVVSPVYAQANDSDVKWLGETRGMSVGVLMNGDNARDLE